jgi:hypothetical protein
MSFSRVDPPPGTAPAYPPREGKDVVPRAHFDKTAIFVQPLEQPCGVASPAVPVRRHRDSGSRRHQTFVILVQILVRRRDFRSCDIPSAAQTQRTNTPNNPSNQVDAADKDSFDQAILLICITRRSRSRNRSPTFVNVAPLQLSQEFLRVHCGIPMRRRRSVNRGSLRIGSHTGSSL